MITYYGPNVRVVCQGSPFDGPDVFVETLVVNDPVVGPVWGNHSSFNSLSNDWAYTSAKELAMDLEKKHAD